MKFQPLSSGFGLETSTVDLGRPMPAKRFRELEHALFDGQVLVLRGQRLTAGQFVAFARRFGPPEPHAIDQFHHPDDPTILIRSNVMVDGKPSGLVDAETYFHTDCAYLPVPARATMLYSIEVPETGGQTLFANQYAAWNSLPDAMRRRVEPLRALHRYVNRDDPDEVSRTVASVLAPEQQAKVPPVTHPIVRAHPVTGRRALYAVSGSSCGIVGMPDDEAVALLAELAAHATRPEFCYRHDYAVGDVVIWDNASLLHSATPTDPACARTLWQVTIKEPLPAAKGSRAVRSPG